MAKILPEADNMRDFKNNELLMLIIKLLRECYNKESIIKVLEILDFLSDDYFLRVRLNQLKVFSELLKFYGESWANRDLEMLFRVFILFGKFTREMSFKIMLISHLELENDFSGLFEPFKEENYNISSPKVKSASLEVIRNLILNGPSEELRDVMARSTFLKSILRDAMNDDDDGLKSFALDCLLSLNDLVSDGIMSLDDIVFDLDKIIRNKNSEIQSKLLLFISWGLLTECIDISLIRQGFLTNVIESGFEALEKGETERFRRSHCVIALLLERDNWSEQLLAMQYYEKYLTGRISNEISTRKAWFEGMILLASHDSFRSSIRSNPNLLKFLWFEINQNCETFNLQIILLVKSTLVIPELLKHYNDEFFILKLLRGFLESYQKYPDDLMTMCALEVFHSFCYSKSAINVYLRSKNLFAFLRLIWSKGNNQLNKLTTRIYREIIAEANESELKQIVNEEFLDSFRMLTKF